MAGLYQSLTLKVTKDVIDSIKKMLQAEDKQQHQNQHEGFSFQKSNIGLYLGAVMLAGSALSVTLFFYNIQDEDQYDTANIIFYTSGIIMHLAVLVATIWAIYSFRNLSYTLNRDNSIDNVLLLIAIGGLFLFEV